MKIRRKVPATAENVTEVLEKTPAEPLSSGQPAFDPVPLAELMREADQRLAQSPTLASKRVKSSLADLPLYILTGPAGVGKTSTFLASGLSPELLAGQVQRESIVLPTSLSNFWYTSDAIFVEAGGRFFADDPGQWRGFVHRLCGASHSILGKLRAGRTPQAGVRGVIWFCDVIPFLGIPEPSRIGTMARKVQERLHALGEALGSSFPVYVVFTKADQIPHFDDFIHRMPDEEDRQVLGCTWPVSNLPRSGEVYADAQTRRLLDPFNQLYASLAEKRLKLLAREPESARKPGIYEFPRELKRIRDSLIHFLVDAFRPNPLQPGPLLRGFYFTAVRQVPVRTASPGAVLNGRSADPKNLDATVLFQAAAPTAENTVPRWTFTTQLFHDVILRDPLGRAAGAENVRRDRKNRVLLATAAAVNVLVALCLICSWWGNWTLLSDAGQAAQGQFARPAPGGLPSAADLRSMDGLRRVLEPLVEYGRDGAPWRLRWGLYSGDRILKSAYDAYFELFRRYFLTDAEAAFVARLARVSAQDRSVPYSAAYDTLKAYRMTTSGACPADAAFLVPVFTQSWQSGRAVDGERLQLIEQQVNFYANELGHKNPYAIEENPELVAQSRAFLSTFGGVDRLFRGIVAEANKLPRQPSRIADLAPNFRQVLTGPGEVQAAFTREGWAYAQQAIREPNEQSAGEACVVGGSGASTPFPQGSQVASQLSAMYTRAYMQAWKDFLTSTGVQPFRSAAEAAQGLEILADNRSPLLAALFLAAENTSFSGSARPAASATAAQSASTGLLARILPAAAKKAAPVNSSSNDGNLAADLARVFQPVHEMVPAGNRDRLIGDPNRDYVNALSEMQQAMARLKDDPPSNPDLTLNAQAQQAAEKGLDSVRQMAQKFNITGSEGTDVAVQRLLESPFRYSMRFVITDPSKVARDKLAGAAKSFCVRLSALEREFPFNPQSDIDAPPDEVAAVFAPPSGALFLFEQQLGKLVVKEGKEWVQNPDTPSPRVTPEFLQFLNHMTAISGALFEDGSAQMKLGYGLKLVPGSGVESISLDIDGQQLTATSGQAETKAFNWPGPAGAQQVLIRVKAGANIPFASYEGVWGVFHMLADADPRPFGSRIIELSKVRRGHGLPESVLDQNNQPIQVRLEVTQLPAGAGIFDRNFFQARCPVKVAE